MGRSQRFVQDTIKPFLRPSVSGWVVEKGPHPDPDVCGKTPEWTSGTTRTGTRGLRCSQTTSRTETPTCPPHRCSPYWDRRGEGLGLYTNLTVSSVTDLFLGRPRPPSEDVSVYTRSS